jgi:hypothetical protein
VARRLISLRRRGALALLAAVVLLGHAVLADRLAEGLPSWGRAAPMPPKLQAAFVRELRPTDPPATPPRAEVPPTAVARAAIAPAPAASEPERKKAERKRKLPRKTAADVSPQDSAPRQPDPQLAQAAAEPSSSPPAPSRPSPETDARPSASEPAALAPQPDAPKPQAEGVAAAASSPEVAASAVPEVEWPSAWPASTRLDYRLVGWYRGEVQGHAQVEWLREGQRYQVHLEVVIGAPFAPLMSRRMSSEGELTPQGLSPQRYDEETKAVFRSPRRVTMRFDPESIVLANGQRRVRWPGVQDTASQFVQLTWLFTTQPQLLTPGQTIELPLALPRNVDRWVFDVQEAETLSTPFGALPVVHLKPRRVSRPGGDLVVETWFAPSLLYLPVRIRIHQDAETFVDLTIERPPLQAATR